MHMILSFCLQVRKNSENSYRCYQSTFLSITARKARLFFNGEEHIHTRREYSMISGKETTGVLL